MFLKKFKKKIKSIVLNKWLPIWYRLSQMNSFLNTEKRTEYVVASITSFPARIQTLHLVIESLLRQSFKLDKICVYFVEGEFESQKLPKPLEKLRKKGVDFCFKTESIRSHGKYFHAMRAFPQALVITFDDDIIYNSRIVETLVKTHISHPNCVVGTRCTRMICDKNRKLKGYLNWCFDWSLADKPDFLCFPTGIGGILYPPKSLAKEAFDVAAIKELCPMADDIWLKMMELLNNVPAIQTKRKFDLIYIDKLQKGPTLASQNFSVKDDLNLNDLQLKKICSRYSLNNFFEV